MILLYFISDYSSFDVSEGRSKIPTKSELRNLRCDPSSKEIADNNKMCSSRVNSGVQTQQSGYDIKGNPLSNDSFVCIYPNFACNSNDILSRASTPIHIEHCSTSDDNAYIGDKLVNYKEATPIRLLTNGEPEKRHDFNQGNNELLFRGCVTRDIHPLNQVVPLVTSEKGGNSRAPQNEYVTITVTDPIESRNPLTTAIKHNCPDAAIATSNYAGPSYGNHGNNEPLSAAVNGSNNNKSCTSSVFVNINRPSSKGDRGEAAACNKRDAKGQGQTTVNVSGSS